MSCDAQQTAFEDKLGLVQEELKRELDDIAAETEAKAKEIEEDFEAGNDLAEGVGAAAGTAVGGYLGGPAGAAVGNVVGRQIGQLFTLEIQMRRETVSLDVPQTTMRTRDFSFDLPVVRIDDRDIIFDLPVVEMRRTEGPPIPKTTIRWENKCIGPRWARVCTKVPVTVVEWEPSYFDIPVTVMREQRIVVGLPSVEMQRQELTLDVPEIAMRRQEFSFDVPSITLRFVRDAGRRTAALAAALAQSAQDAATQKQIGFQDRLRSEVAPLALDMFGCFRNMLLSNRTDAESRFAPQIATLSASLTGMAGRGVPDTDDDFVRAKEQLTHAIAQRDEALRSFDEALAQLDQSSREAMQQFLGAGGSDEGAVDAVSGVSLAENESIGSDEPPVAEAGESGGEPDGPQSGSIGGLVHYTA